MKKIFKGYVENVSEKELSKYFNDCLNTLKEEDLLVKRFYISKPLVVRLGLENKEFDYEFKDSKNIKEIFDLIVSNLGEIIKVTESYELRVEEYTSNDTEIKNRKIEFLIFEGCSSQNYLTIEFVNKYIHNSLIEDINKSDLPIEIKDYILHLLSITVNEDYSLEVLYNDIINDILEKINRYLNKLNHDSDIVNTTNTLMKMKLGEKLLDYLKENLDEKIFKFIRFEYTQERRFNSNRLEIFFNGNEIKTIEQIFYTKCKLV